MSIDLRTVELIAAELGVSTSFIEKDWYAMRVIAKLLTVNNPNFRLVFSGGTSLSKGDGLIKRFSEDIDFKAVPIGKNTRRERGEYRNQIIEVIRQNSAEWLLNDDGVVSRNENNFFQFTIKYLPLFDLSRALRPHIKVEITITLSELTYEEKILQSFISQALNNKPEVISILCVSPIETAIDKISALTWRILAREAGNTNYDPTHIRHLHDLAALKNILVIDNKFSELVFQTLQKDAKRAEELSLFDASPTKLLDKVLQFLKKNPVYQKEYNDFVLAMSYASEDEILSFKKALLVFNEIVKKIKSYI